MVDWYLERVYGTWAALPTIWLARRLGLWDQLVEWDLARWRERQKTQKGHTK